MPTMGRAVAAVLLAALAWLVSQLLIPLWPEGVDLGWFAEVNALMGFLVGWTFLGRRAGQGFVNAVSFGLTAAALTVFWALFVHSTWLMLENALDRTYGDALEAIVGVFELLVRNAAFMSSWTVWALLLGGGVAIAIVTELTVRRFD